jgi:Ribbon-helix-helix protein, copG family
MKKIAIDETTSKLLDELAEFSSRRRSRTALVRVALRQYAERERRRKSESSDGALFRKHRKRLAREARALMRSKRVREARRDLPHARAGRGTRSQARFLRCRIQNLCRRTRSRVDGDLCAGIRGSPRAHDGGGIRTGRRAAAYLRDSLLFPHLDV